MPSIDSNHQGPGVRWSPTSFSTGRELCDFVMWTGTVAPLRAGGKMLPDRKQRNGRKIRFLLTSLFTCWHQTYESLMIKQSKSNKHVLQPFQFFCLFVILEDRFWILESGFWSLDVWNWCAWPKTRGDKKKDKEKSLSSDLQILTCHEISWPTLVTYLSRPQATFQREGLSWSQHSWRHPHGHHIRPTRQVKLGDPTLVALVVLGMPLV